MARLIATGDDSCVVFSKTGSGSDCKFPRLTNTDQCSDKVFVGGLGVVCQDDQVKNHPKASDCSNDDSVLTTYSSKVTINGKGVGRIGDKYGSDNIIITAKTTKVFIGG